MKRALFILCFALGSGGLQAGLTLPIDLEKDSGAKIEVRSFLDELPSRGYAPLEATIQNSSGAPRQWTFNFSSPGRGRNLKLNMLSSETVTVENNATRTIPLLVPVSPSLAEMPWTAGLQIDVRGFKTGANANNQMIGGSNPPSRQGAFVAISTKLGTPIWTELTQATKVGSRSELYGSLFEPDRLPEDWRALSGIDGIWLMNEEFAKLSSSQRSALRTWAQMGGTLTLCGATDVPDDFKNVFFGKVKLGPEKLAINTVKEAIHGLAHGPTGFDLLTDTTLKFPPIKPNVPLLLTFVILFAIFIGPINIFVLAGAAHRHRLFWTTPLISVAASILLTAFIFLQDGTGGSGTRAALIYVMPDEHRQILVQQQTSRTGPLFGGSFQTTEPVVITPLGVNDQKRVLKNNCTFFSGDWFISRSIQTQKIQSVIPSRGEITLLNADAVKDQSTVPLITSSFPAPLENLVYEDAQKRRWNAQNVLPGQKVALTPGQPNPNLLDRLSHPMPPISAGSFFATNRDPSAFMNTLDSIRWNDEPVIYFGPVSLP